MTDIRLEMLRKEFKETVAVNDVTMSFPSSEVTCLLGPSGCGKTTLLRMIAGLEEPTSGEIYFGDLRVTDLPPRRREIGMVFQYPVVYRGISVYRNIELPLIEAGVAEAERRRRIGQVIDVLGLRDVADTNTDLLDGSTRQKVAVARTVARQPEIIMFDEPLTNVDVDTRVQIKAALKELTAQLKKTILYVTHDQTDAMTLADQIALMNEGVIVQRDAPRELYNFPNDVFGGWFLGNPGMNFFEYEVEPSGDCFLLNSPLFPQPMMITGKVGGRKVTIGIRPERVRVGFEPTPTAVRGRLDQRSIVVGGQYLLAVDVQGQRIKAKVEPAVGQRAQGEVWVECPLDWVTVFNTNGRRIEGQLAACPTS
jgi:ABC-type sugar transport system ATPase subunit